MKAPCLSGLIDSLDINIQRQSLHERFTKEAVSFLQKVLATLQEICLGEKLDLKLLKTFSKVVICYSSWWQISEKLKDIFPGFGGASSKALCRLQLAYDFVRGQIDCFSITEGTKNDSVYAFELVEQLCKGALLLVDLGYSSARFFASLQEKGIYFISKLKSTIKVFHPITKRQINLLKTLKSINVERFEFDILLGLNQDVEIPCRLIGEKVPKEVAQKRRQRHRKLAKKSGETPRKITLELCDWTLMITNIPHKIVKAKQILTLYRIRWQVELIFKQFKSTLQLHRNNTSNHNRLLCEIYGRLIAATIITKVHGSINSTLWNTEKVELSLEKFFKRIQERAFTLITKILDSLQNGINYLYFEIKKCIRSCIKVAQRSKSTSMNRLICSSVVTFKKINLRYLLVLS